MKFILLILSGVFFFTSANGQTVQVKLDSFNLNFPKNKISKNRCYKDSLNLKPFYYDKDESYKINLPPIRDIFKSNEGEFKSIIFELEWGDNVIILTIIEYPQTEYNLDELFLKEYLNIFSEINTKYDIGIETINENQTYWLKELVPDSEFGAYSNLFYLYNNRKSRIYSLDFSVFKKPNCGLNALMIDVLESLDW